MRTRLKELHYEYCTPKPTYYIKVWDSDVEVPPEENIEERESIDIYVHIIV